MKLGELMKQWVSSFGQFEARLQERLSTVLTDSVGSKVPVLVSIDKDEPYVGNKDGKVYLRYNGRASGEDLEAIEISLKTALDEMKIGGKILRDQSVVKFTINVPSIEM